MIPDSEDIRATVRRALAEDLGDGDRSAALIDTDLPARAAVICREPAVLCGCAWFNEVFRQLDAEIEVHWLADDGDTLDARQTLCHVRGAARAILTGERTALNLLQTLSGTATRTRRYVEAIAGTAARILDTRKTLPGLRRAQKYAVRCGGGQNHRLGLFDGVLIKENHILAAGSIETAVKRARAGTPPGMLLELEVESLAQLEQALAAGVERVLLDNFDLAGLQAAVRLTAGRAKLEASGGINLHNIRAIAETGVDFISIGDLTKSLDAIDLSLRFELPASGS